MAAMPIGRDLDRRPQFKIAFYRGAPRRPTPIP